MLWLLPQESGLARVRVDPGVHGVPRWYDRAELVVLVELLSRYLEPGVEHALLLPADAIVELRSKAAAGSPLLLAATDRGDLRDHGDLERWAREHRHHLLVSVEDRDDAGVVWLERSIKPIVIELLEHGPWHAGHPLASLGLRDFDIDELAGCTEDPVELLWLLDRLLRHRLRHLREGAGPQDYARSLRHAVGSRCAEKLRRHGGDVTAALDVLLMGTDDLAGRATLVEAGLGFWRGGQFEEAPLLRLVSETLVSSTIIEQLGWESLSDDAKKWLLERRTSTEVPQRATSLAPQPQWDAASADQGSLAAVLRAGLSGVVGPPEVLTEFIHRVDACEQAPWNRAALEHLRALSRSLKSAAETPLLPHRTLVEIARRLLVILTVTEHAQLQEALAARDALRRALGDPLEGWSQELWLLATMRCASRHRMLAAARADLEQASSLLRDVISSGAQDSHPRTIAEAYAELAEVEIIRGNLDDASAMLIDEALPTFERTGERRMEAMINGRIADIHQMRGNFDQALELQKHRVLPVFEALGESREIAIAQGKIADVLHMRGNIEDAVRVRREEQLPIYEELGDTRAIAVTKGKLADALRDEGKPDAALRLLESEVLPAFEALESTRDIAVTIGRIATLEEMRGDLEGALRMRREREIPMLQRLGDVRSEAMAWSRIADIAERQGRLDEALRIRKENSARADLLGRQRPARPGRIHQP